MLPDSYVWRARIAPATLALAPLATLGVHLDDELWFKAIPSVVVAVMIFLAGEVVRRAGRRLQTRLVKQWDGLPTTQRLRPTGLNDGNHSRRNDVALASGIELPSASSQEADPAAGDREIAEAVHAAIVTMRAHGPDRAILARENASYGFARNAAAIKPVGVSVAALTTIFHIVLLSVGMWHPTLGAGALSIGSSLVILLVWLFAVGSRQTRQQAEFFAQHFFAALRSFLAGKS